MIASDMNIQSGFGGERFDTGGTLVEEEGGVMFIFNFVVRGFDVVIMLTFRNPIVLIARFRFRIVLI